MADDGPLFLLDGNSLVFRAFFALPIDLATRSGQVTNAVYGFTSMLVNLLRDLNPSGIGVAFDRPEPTFRDEVVEDYKGNRPETPDLLIPQFALVRDVLAALGLRTLEVPGYEADDILATLATAARDTGRDVVVVSGDRDAFQLVEDPHIKVMYTRKGLSDTVVYDEAGIAERYGVPPSSYAVLASLRGDPSDNLAGVPGVGEKTAAKLVTSYGTLDGIFAHLDELTPKLRQNLAENEDRVRRNAKVIPLVRDVPLELGLDDLALGHWDSDEVKRVFGELEMPTLWQRLAPLMGNDETPLPRSTLSGSGPAFDVSSVVAEIPATAAAVVAALEGLADAAVVSVAPLWSGDAGRSALAGLALAGVPAGAGAETAAEAGRSAVWIGPDLLTARPVLDALATLFGPGGREVVAHGAKELMRVLLPEGVDMVALSMDSAVAAYLLDPSSGRYRLEDVVDAHLGVALDAAVQATAAGQLDLEGEASEDVAEQAARRAVALGAVVAPLRTALETAGLTKLHDEVERPLVRVPGPHGGGGHRRRRQRAASHHRLLRGRVRPAGGRDPQAGRRGLQRQLDPAAARHPLRQAAARRRSARPRPATPPTPQTLETAPRTSIRSSRPSCATARWRSCAPPTARASWPRWRPTGASTPRSTRPSPAPAGSRRTGPTSTTSRSAPRRAGDCDAPSCRRRAPAPGRRLRPDRAAGHRPPVGRPGPRRGLRRGPRHPPDDGGPRLRRRRPRRSRRPSATGRRWSPTASPTAWRPSAWPSGSASRRRRPQEILDAVLQRLPLGARPHGEAPSPRPGRRATPRPRSDGAARCPDLHSDNRSLRRPPSARP